MSKIKFTKGELKRQRDSLKQFQHYLPTLILKKQQLQTKILEGHRTLALQKDIAREKIKNIEAWAGLLADPELEIFDIDLKSWITPAEIVTSAVNIAGANVPVFENICFPEAHYDFFAAPFWLDKGIEELRLLVTLLAEIEVTKRQLAILEQELRVTTQRVNLFEKVKIPECQENIRRIRIYLGDQMASAVGISKAAKKKVEEKILEEITL